jgi:hypothetical protein
METSSALLRVMRTSEPGVISPRSYLPMAWADTLLSIASASPRNERPAFLRASLIRVPIMVAKFTNLYFCIYCKLSCLIHKSKNGWSDLIDWRRSHIFMGRSPSVRARNCVGGGAIFILGEAITPGIEGISLLLFFLMLTSSLCKF